jgi:hypothetical protein
MSVYDFTIFKNSAFAETIVYTPSGGSPVSIKAVVFRHGAQKIDVRGGIPTQHYPVIVEIDRNDIASVMPQEDKITCLDICGVSKEFRVSKVLYSDVGCFKLGLGL